MIGSLVIPAGDVALSQAGASPLAISGDLTTHGLLLGLSGGAGVPLSIQAAKASTCASS